VSEHPFLHSIYTKLVVTFLLVIVPLYVVSLQINQSDARSVRDGIGSSLRSQVHFYMNSLELEFDQVIRFQQELATHTQLDMLSNASAIMTTEEKRKAILEVQQQLIQLKFSSKYIENTKAYVPELGGVITASQPYFELPEAEFDAMRNYEHYTGLPFYNWEGKLYVRYINPLLMTAPGFPPFLLATEINQRKIKQTLQQIIYDGVGGTALISEKRDWQIATDSDTQILETIMTTAQESGGHTSEMRSIRYQERDYLYVYDHSPSLGASLIIYVPEDEVFGPLKRNRERIWYLSIFSLIVVALVSYIIYRLVLRPLRKFMIAFRQVGNGNFNITIDSRNKDEFAMLFTHFNQTVKKLEELVYEVYEQKYRAQNAELKQLQSQINPHFLYNSFFTIYRMAKLKDTIQIEKFATYLGNYYRFITRNSSDEVTLGEEVEHARTYVDIQFLRFQDRMFVEFAPLPSEWESFRVPRLILQPIIENAFEYALENKAEDGLLTISFVAASDGIKMIVEDNGDELPDATLDQLNQQLRVRSTGHETTGIINVHRRLQLKYGEKATVQLSRGSSGGLRVVLFIPNK